MRFRQLCIMNRKSSVHHGFCRPSCLLGLCHRARVSSCLCCRSQLLLSTMIRWLFSRCFRTFSHLHSSSSLFEVQSLTHFKLVSGDAHCGYCAQSDAMIICPISRPRCVVLRMPLLHLLSLHVTEKQDMTTACIMILEGWARLNGITNNIGTTSPSATCPPTLIPPQVCGMTLHLFATQAMLYKHRQRRCHCNEPGVYSGDSRCGTGGSTT